MDFNGVQTVQGKNESLFVTLLFELVNQNEQIFFQVISFISFVE